MSAEDKSFLWRHSISDLRRLGQRVVRETEMAERFAGESELIAEVVDIEGDRSEEEWREVLLLYCGTEHCDQCPHGPFVFLCRRDEGSDDVVRIYEGRRWPAD